MVPPPRPPLPPPTSDQLSPPPIPRLGGIGRPGTASDSEGGQSARESEDSFANAAMDDFRAASGGCVPPQPGMRPPSLPGTSQPSSARSFPPLPQAPDGQRQLGPQAMPPPLAPLQPPPSMQQVMGVPIDPSESMALLSDADRELLENARRVLQEFSEVDEDGDGMMGESELRGAFRRFGRGPPPPNDILDRLLANAGVTADGRVPYEDFMRYIATKLGVPHEAFMATIDGRSAISFGGQAPHFGKAPESRPGTGSSDDLASAGIGGMSPRFMFVDDDELNAAEEAGERTKAAMAASMKYADEAAGLCLQARLEQMDFSDEEEEVDDSDEENALPAPSGSYAASMRYAEQANELSLQQRLEQMDFSDDEEEIDEEETKQAFFASTQKYAAESGAMALQARLESMDISDEEEEEDDEDEEVGASGGEAGDGLPISPTKLPEPRPPSGPGLAPEVAEVTWAARGQASPAAADAPLPPPPEGPVPETETATSLPAVPALWSAREAEPAASASVPALPPLPELAAPSQDAPLPPPPKPISENASPSPPPPQEELAAARVGEGPAQAPLITPPPEEAAPEPDLAEVTWAARNSSVDRPAPPVVPPLEQLISSQAAGAAFRMALASTPGSATPVTGPATPHQAEPWAAYADGSTPGTSTPQRSTSLQAPNLAPVEELRQIQERVEQIHSRPPSAQRDRDGMESENWRLRGHNEQLRHLIEEARRMQQMGKRVRTREEREVLRQARTTIKHKFERLELSRPKEEDQDPDKDKDKSDHDQARSSHE